MSTAAPGWLRAQIRAHNRHARWLAVLSLGAAAVAWGTAYFFFTLILLGVETSIHGDRGPQVPAWISAAALGLAAALLLWGFVDHLHRRYQGVSDRPIIGWHLFADFLLLPVRLTFAVWGNFSAVRRLDSEEIQRAWNLLSRIQRDGKSRLSALTLVEPDPNRLFRLLGTLQMLELVDLHRGDEDWFYTVRSDRGDELGKLLASSD
jgi:hypothetical protein